MTTDSAQGLQELGPPGNLGPLPISGSASERGGEEVGTGLLLRAPEAQNKGPGSEVK